MVYLEICCWEGHSRRCLWIISDFWCLCLAY